MNETDCVTQKAPGIALFKPVFVAVLLVSPTSREIGKGANLVIFNSYFGIIFNQSSIERTGTILPVWLGTRGRKNSTAAP